MAITEFEFLEPERVDAVKTPANGTAWLMLKAAEERAVYSEDGLVKYVSADARRKYAESGVAMPSGDFPIPDEGHLRSAIGLLGNYSGDKAAAKAHIISRARALGLTHLLPEEWNVKKEAVPAESTRQTEELHASEGAPVAPAAGDGGEPPHCEAEDERPPADGGEGDTAPDKAVPVSEADSQTDGAQKADRENPHGDHADTEGADDEGDADDDGAQKAKDPDLVTHGTGDTPGSHVWEAHDVALAEQAVEAAQRTLELARRFAAREKAEMSGADTSTSKEIIDMDRDELIKLLDERDEARRAAEAAKGADDVAAKAQDGQPAAEGLTADVHKSLESITTAITNLQKQVDAIAEQDTRPRPVQNGAGIPRANDSTSSSAFKALDDAVDNARNQHERRDAARRRTMAKLIAGRPGQVATISGLGTPIVTNSHELPADAQVVGI